MKIEINLSQHQYEKKSTVFLFYVLTCVIILSAILYCNRLIYSYNEQLINLEERNNNLKKELEKENQKADSKGLSEKDSIALSKKVDYVNMLIQKQAFSWTAFIYHLEEKTPDEISITEITPSFAENKIKIIGLAKTVDDIVKFVNNLQSSNYFKDVFLLEHDNVEIEKNNLIKFTVNSKYEMDEK